jgi:hypothetical protein
VLLAEEVEEGAHAADAHTEERAQIERHPKDDTTGEDDVTRGNDVTPEDDITREDDVNVDAARTTAAGYGVRTGREIGGPAIASTAAFT